jgi:20S proteasome alpha/beta subunit
LLDEIFTHDELEDISLRYVDMDNNQRIDSLTTVLGIKSNNGILLTSDSKVSNEYVKDRSSKIFRINKSIGVAVSGDLGHIKILLDKLAESLLKIREFTELTLRQKIDDEVVCPLFREYNVERVAKLGLKPVLDMFEASAIVSAKTEDRSFVMYRLNFWPKPSVYLVEDDYESIGTGGWYAQLLMRQHLRANPAGLSANSIEYNKWYALIIINEIKSFDAKSGGPTHLAVLDESDFTILNTQEVRDYYIQKRESAARNTVEQQKQFGISYEQIFSYFPDP